MRAPTLLVMLAIAGCSRPPTPPATYSGYYESDGVEYSTFRPMGNPSERWQLAGPHPCAFINFDQERHRPWHRVFMEVQGTLSPPGKYGHMGLNQRELSVIRVVSCRPLRVGETVGP
jgi:hypothetical protein